MDPTNPQKPPDYEDAIKDKSTIPSQGSDGTYWNLENGQFQYGGQYAYANPTMVHNAGIGPAVGNNDSQIYGYVVNDSASRRYSDDPNADAELGHESLVKPDGMLFDDKTIRAGFIRKVFGILTVQLAFVVGLIALFVYHDGTRLFVQSNSWLYFASYITFLVTYLLLVCVRDIRRKFPGNVIALGFLTASMGYMAAMISCYHETDVVLMALGICTGCCLTVIIFSCQTKYDFTKCTGVMFVITMVMFIFGVVAIMMAIYSRNNIMYLVYAGIMALVFMVWLAIDVQMVIGGGKQYEISPEDYVMAATELFIDVVYIFLFILQLLGGSNN